jgi:hypothetical protein
MGVKHPVLEDYITLPSGEEIKMSFTTLSLYAFMLPQGQLYINTLN